MPRRVTLPVFEMPANIRATKWADQGYFIVRACLDRALRRSTFNSGSSKKKVILTKSIRNSSKSLEE